jgi:hypothetical protein
MTHILAADSLSVQSSMPPGVSVIGTNSSKASSLHVGHKQELVVQRPLLCRNELPAWIVPTSLP